MSFDGKVAIVTGAASGVGRATAAQLAGLGARVVLADIDAERGERVAADLRAEGGQAEFEGLDLASTPELEKLVTRTQERHGQIDVLANVAAVYPSVPFLETTPERWERIVGINLRAVYFLSQAVIRAMLPRRYGTVVNVASGAAFRPVPNMSAYSAAKGGLVAMTRAIAHEVAAHGIRVNVVSPGHTASETVRAAMSEEQLAAAGEHLFPGRWMEPEEVAEAIVFVASDAASGMNGAIVHVNGGDYMPH